MAWSSIEKILKSKYLWAAFQGVEIQKKAVILPIDDGIGIIIPGSAFSSDAERYDFAAVISKGLEGSVSRERQHST